ncbi:DNA repair protein RecO [Mycoplasmatota bacterium WC44]
MANNYEGIVIRSIDYSDSSKIIYLITESGIESLLVKGARKIKSNLRQLCQSITKISYNKSNSKKLPVLFSGDIEKVYFNTKQDLEKSTYVYHLFEIIYKLSNEIDFPTLYKFLELVLDKINSGEDVELIAFVFELKFLYLLGLNPVFSKCADCDATDVVGFDVYRGGMVCANHRTEYTISDRDVILGLYKLYFQDVNQDIDYEINKRIIRKLLDEYYNFYMNFNSKSREMLKNIYGY